MNDFTGFNFLSHGSQDLYPTYIQENKRLSSRLATKATIIGNCVRIFDVSTFMMSGWTFTLAGSSREPLREWPSQIFPITPFIINLTVEALWRGTFHNLLVDGLRSCKFRNIYCLVFTYTMLSEFSAASLEVGNLELDVAHFSIRVISPLFHVVFIPLWILPTGFSGLAAGAFCIQIGVQGAWGVVSLIRHIKEATQD